jgi:hypothetical protein
LSENDRVAAEKLIRESISAVNLKYQLSAQLSITVDVLQKPKKKKQ